MAAAVSYTFAPEQYPDGLLIVRRWTLAGKDGSVLTETVSASSATGHARQVAFQDEIPTAVARTTQTVVFTPAPAKIVKADPVVEWVLQLPSHGTVRVGYHATVPAQGATKARLMGLVKDFDALQAAAPTTAKPHEVQLASLAIVPGAVQLKPGGSTQLVLTGQLSNGQAAPQAVLGNAAWNSANPAVASVTPLGTVTAVSAGSTEVTAQIGSAQASVPVTVVAAGPTKSPGTGTTKSAAAQQITFTSTPPSSPAVSSTYDVAASGGGSGNPVTFTTGSSVCSITGSTATTDSISSTTVIFNQAGSCVIDANQAGNTKYAAAPQAQQTITVKGTVGKIAQNITYSASEPATGTPNGSATLSATGGGSGNPVLFSVDSSSETVCSVFGDTVSYLAAGSCVIDANQAGNAKYAAAPQAQLTITITVAALTGQTITFTAPVPTGTAGTTATVSATGGGSGNPVLFSVGSSNGVCSLSGDTVSYLAAGSCVIDANQAGNAKYAAAPQAQLTITVAGIPQAIPQTITFTAPAPPTGTADGTAAVSATGGLSGNPVLFSVGSSNGVCSLSGDTVIYLTAGSCVIDANQAGNAKYTAAPQAQLTITVSAGASPPAGTR